MQKFTLALWSPIYSISVTLATLLLASGAGSLLSEKLSRRLGSTTRLIGLLSALVTAYLAAMILGGSAALNAVTGWTFPARVLLCCAMLAPIGLCLGCFFPVGLQRLGAGSSEAVVWAWGINLGFTVLGSTLSIFVAQFWGFSAVLALAGGIYLVAGLSYCLLSRGMDAQRSMTT
jgi:hypothetical protein